MAPPNRKGGGGLSPRTLTIASLASATAALVTSRLFPPGTIFTAALTPVIVTIVNELVSRPVDRVAALREQRRTMVLEAREARVAQALGETSDPLTGAPDFALGEEAPEPASNGHRRSADPLAGVRAFQRPPWWKRIHPRVALATGLIAFVIALGALTLPELIFGGAVASNHRTTFFGGGSSSTKTHTTTTPQSTTTTPETTTTTVPAQTPTQTTTTETTTTGTETTGTTTAPSGGTPAPTSSSTTPAPAPGGTPPPSG